MAWRDYRDLMRLMEHDMHRLAEEAFTNFLAPPGSMNRFWQPAADIHETDDALQIKVELAGVPADSVQVALSADARRLDISGTRTEPADERGKRCHCHQLEIYFGPFERTFYLPPDLLVERDLITATLKDGFLTITLPRRAASATVTTRNIPISVEE